MNKNKSAKDIAWDKERAKYQKQIRDLNDAVEIWKEEFRDAADLCNKLSEENTKLKELLELDDESLQLWLGKERTKETLTALFNVCNRMGGGRYL